MQYLKSVAKNMYQKVIEDQYLQKLSQQEIYIILNNTTRSRLSSHHKDPRKMSQLQIQTQLWKKVQEIAAMTPERVFRAIGNQPRVDIVKAKERELTETLDEISGVMNDNFNKYEAKINLAVAVVDQKNMYVAKKGCLELRNKLQNLHQSTKKSTRIMKLFIKSSNLKKIIKSLSQIPNIQKMSLTELKSINLQQLKNRSILGKLNCLKGIEGFVEKAVSGQLRQVLDILQKCIVQKFQQQLYENALKDFIIAQHQTIKYQKLLIKVVQNYMRKVDSEMQSNVIQICQFYIKLMINLHSLFRWHRLNQKQQKWQNLSKGYYGISIQINIQQITQKLTQIMDECLKQTIVHNLLSQSQQSHYLSLLYLTLRMNQLSHAFSGEYLPLSLKQPTQFLYKKLLKLAEKASMELEETLKLEEKNCWNRLPVVDQYSHQVVDKTLYQILGHRGSESYHKVIEVLKDGKRILKAVQVQVEGKRGRIVSNLWDIMWGEEDKRNKSVIKSSKQISPKKQEKKEEQTVPSSNPSDSQPQPLESWELEHPQFPHITKFDRNRQKFSIHNNSFSSNSFSCFSSLSSLPSLPSLSPQPHKTIICQYSLTILKYFQHLVKYLFYYPIEPILSFTLSSFSSIIQYYVFYLFNCFISSNLKFIFYNKQQQMQMLQQRYHKKRLHYQYPLITQFIASFKTPLSHSEPLHPHSQSHLKHSNTYSYPVPLLSTSSQSFIGINLTGSTSFSDKEAGLNANSNSNNNGNTNTGLKDGNRDGGKENLIIRSRVVAIESFRYVVMYYRWAMAVCGIYDEHKDGKADNNGKQTAKDNAASQAFKSQTSIESPQSALKLSTLHPSLSQKISQKLSLYLSLYSQLCEFIYTDCVPKLCKLKQTQSFIQSIKWSDPDLDIEQYVHVFGKQCMEFYWKMNANGRGEVPQHICDRLFGVYWKTQLTAIVKAFTGSYRPGKFQGKLEKSPKHKLEKFIDGLYENLCSVVKQKSYLRNPYEKIKAVFPILLESSPENAFQMLKISLQKYEFVYAVEMGLFLTCEGCCYLGNDDLQQKKKVVQNWIDEKLLKNSQISEKKQK